MSTNPNEILEAPEQVAIPNGSKVLKETVIPTHINGSGVANTSTVPEEKKAAKLKPSEDFDLTNVKTKPLPRLPGEPSYRGWKEVGGWVQEDTLTADDYLEDLTTKSRILDQYLPAVAYGDWYHNAGYLIVGGLLSWFIGWWRFSLAPVFPVMLVFMVLYRTSILKYRSNLREQAQREFSIKLIENDYESMDWLNLFLEKFWYFLEPSISQIITDQANPILASSPAPAFIKKLWIDSFTAGTKPPRIDCVKTLPGTEDNIVVMDWGCSFVPNALADANNKQMKSRVNQKTVVKLNLFGVLPITVAVSDVSFKATFRIRMRMMTSFPHVETVNVSLIQAPEIDFNSKLFGDTIWNWEFLSIPGLYPLINEMIKKYVGPMLFEPLSFQLNLQQLMAGNALNSAIGVLAINAKSARGLKGFNTLGNTLDPYLTFGFNNEVVARTKTIDDTAAPTWNEIIYIPVKLMSEPLSIKVVDFNDFREDREVGTIQFDMEQLIQNPKLPNLTVPFIRNNKPVGELLFGLNFMPTIDAQKQVDGSVIPPPDLNTGIARIEIVEARQLRGTEKGMNIRAELFINNEKKFTTKVQKNTKNPGWGANHEDIITNRSKTKVRIVVYNGEAVLGQAFSSLNNLIDATQVDETWFPLGKGGEVRIKTTWKPVGLSNASGSGSYTPPIGVVRVSIEKAEDLRNLETIGTVDPYVRLLVNGFERSRTAAEKSTLNPTWNEAHYVSVTSANQKLTIEAMDVEITQADRTLGLFDVKLNEIINRNEEGKYIDHQDVSVRHGKLVHKKGPKGVVSYSLNFYPILPIMTVEEIKDEEDAEKQRQEEKAKKEEEAAAAAASEGTTKDSSKDKNAAPIPVEEEDVEETISNSKQKLSLDELVEYQSGVLAYEILDGDFTKNDVYLQLYFDNHGYADFLSQKITKKSVTFGVSGDIVIKELDWSKTCIRLVKNKKDNRLKDPVAEINIPTMQLLKNGYGKSTTLSVGGSIRIQTQWFPLVYGKNGMPPQDSYKNSGNLDIKVLRGVGLPSADSNGYSDPFVKLYLNTSKKEFFKSKKVKKTLDPVWNEQTSVEILNLFDSEIKVLCYDWDIAESNDLLGIGYIKLKDVNPLQNRGEFEVEITQENGQSGGHVVFQFSFTPAFILNIRGSTTTNAGTSLGAVGGIGKGAVTGIAGAGTKGISGGAKLLKKGFHLGRHSDKE